MDGFQDFDIRIALAVSAFVYLLVAAIRQAGLPDRWAPLASLAIGAALGMMVRMAGIGDGNAMMALLSGVVGSAIASGVYSGTKTVAGR